VRGALRRHDAGAADFTRLLVRLGSDDVHAWQEYSALRRTLIMFFEPSFEAADLADEVLDRIARKLATEEIADITQFAFGVARNVRREYRQSSSGNVEIPENYAGSWHNPEQGVIAAMDARIKHECFMRCMRQFDPQDQMLLLEYHPSRHEKVEETRQKLAAALGLSAGALRSRIARLRDKLEQCCHRCYASGAKPTE
jgi:DNA-directed RNA polymerase specialized sigma24 family protein